MFDFKVNAVYIREGLSSVISFYWSDLCFSWGFKKKGKMADIFLLVAF